MGLCFYSLLLVLIVGVFFWFAVCLVWPRVGGRLGLCTNTHRNSCKTAIAFDTPMAQICTKTHLFFFVFGRCKHGFMH